jgi:hypothetical protein
MSAAYDWFVDEMFRDAKREEKYFSQETHDCRCRYIFLIFSLVVFFCRLEFCLRVSVSRLFCFAVFSFVSVGVITDEHDSLDVALNLASVPIHLFILCHFPCFFLKKSFITDKAPLSTVAHVHDNFFFFLVHQFLIKWHGRDT